jgi:hypothetical protein
MGKMEQQFVKWFAASEPFLMDRLSIVQLHVCNMRSGMTGKPCMYLHQSYPLLLHMPTLPIHAKFMDRRPPRFGVIDPTSIRASIFKGLDVEHSMQRIEKKQD